MDSKRHFLETMFLQRLWRRVKYEDVYLHDCASPREARYGLSRCLTFYNLERCMKP
jgi:putative transposase